MKAMFCDKCGKIMKLTLQEKQGIITKTVNCSCGYERELRDFSVSEIIPQKPEVGKGAADDENLLATFPHECSKCGYNKAEVIDLGVWFGDEAGVVRYKCGKCGITEQDKGSNT